MSETIIPPPPVEQLPPADDRVDDLPTLDELAELLDPASAAALRLSRRPQTAHLASGTLRGDALFGPGDRIVAERRARCLPGHPWLDTRVYRVSSIDEENKVVRCTDEEMRHVAFLGHDDPFTRIFLAPSSGDPFKAPPASRWDSGPEAVEPTGTASPNIPATVPVPVKRGRGRPKGSKNKK